MFPGRKLDIADALLNASKLVFYDQLVQVMDIPDFLPGARSRRAEWTDARCSRSQLVLGF